MRVFRERLSFPIGFKGGIWKLIVLVPDHYVSLFFLTCKGPHSRDSINLTLNLKTESVSRQWNLKIKEIALSVFMIMIAVIKK